MSRTVCGEPLGVELRALMEVGWRARGLLGSVRRGEDVSGSLCRDWEGVGLA